MKVRKKHDIDAVVAAELGMSVKEVRGVTRAFLEQVKNALTELEDVHLLEFGRFRTVIEKAPTHPIELVQVTHNGKRKKKKLIFLTKKVRVHFSKAPAFNRKMRAKHGATEKKS
jgi:hypothetical protein